MSKHYATPSLIQALEIIQYEQRANDSSFAIHLGISRTLWRQTKSGERSVGLTLLKAIILHHPELTTHILEFLRNGNTEVNRNVAKAEAASGT